MKSKRGLIGTILVHGIVFLGLFMLAFQSPGEEEDELAGGILLNFGNSEQGSGENEPEFNTNETPVESSPEDFQPDDANEEILTQDYEESPVIEPVQTDKQVQEKDETRNEVVETPEETEKKETIDPLALFSGKNRNTNTSNNQGVSQGEGNQGNTNGEVNSPDYGKGLYGKGVSADLAGRHAINLPEPGKNFQKEGVVVVEVTVDKQGNVIKAIPGVKKSTTLDESLLKLAKEAALKSKFNVKATAPVIQKGTITYRFRLQ